MKNTVDYTVGNKHYNALLQPTEWRYSAAALGLLKFLKFCNCDYELLNNCSEKPEEAIYGFDGILYDESCITEENYLLFAEDYFKSDMTHIIILNILKKDEFTDEDVKKVNDLIKSKTVLKKVMGNVKFDGTNKEAVVSLIEENRLEIIKSIFRYGKNLYSDYCNSNLLLTESNHHCRLAGYSGDEGRKTRFLGFCFSKDSFAGNDIKEFDFIPFAFSNSDMYETYFINNNYSITTLEMTDKILSQALRSDPYEKKDSRTKLLAVLRNAKKFINYNVEIIVKSRDTDYYSSLYVRADRLKALKDLPEKSLEFSYKIAEDYWLNLEREVYEHCLNNVQLDDLIDRMLKIYFDKNVNKTTVRFKTNALVEINASWKGNVTMTELENAKNCGYYVSKKLAEMKSGNKIKAFRQKLSSAIIAHDYDRVLEVLLKLSNYADMELPFFIKFLEDPEKNKDLAYAFISNLSDPTDNNQTKTTNKGE